MRYIILLLLTALISLNALRAEIQPGVPTLRPELLHVGFPAMKAIANPDTDMGCNSMFDISRSALVVDSCLTELGKKAQDLYKKRQLERFEIRGYSSPDGPEQFNSRLSANRTASVRRYFMDTWGIPASQITVSSIAEDWGKTRELVSIKNLQYKKEILEIIDNTADGDVRESRLRRLVGGNAWRELVKEVFPEVRRAEVLIVYDEGEVAAELSDNGTKITRDIQESEVKHEVVDTVLITDGEPVVTSEAVAEEWQRHAYLKTNIPAWLLLWINAAGEIDIAPHWSANLSIYYSGFDYFTSTRKYRTFTIMPELRYWFRGDNQGFFIAPHFGLGWYNVAFEGAYRYQDHNMRTPAIGGGINAGFRFIVSRNRRWRMEFSIGGGIYHLDYDLFQNRHNGLLVGRRKRTFYGIDNAAISICYMFDVKKKGGRK